MTSVAPKIFFLAQPSVEWDGVKNWLKEIGGNEALTCLDHIDFNFSPDIEGLIELLARRCYKSYAPGLNPNVRKVRTDSSEYIANILKSKHGSVVANGGMVTYAFENVSRVFTHEIVRNVIGTERSQESLRYVRLTDMNFWIPPIIANETEKKYTSSPPTVFSGYSANYTENPIGATPVDIFMHVIRTCEWAQKALAEYYDIDNIPDFNKKKLLTSAFRRVAPMGLATGIGMSFNLRALRWIIEQRTSPHAEEEIRIVFGMVAEDAMQRWPLVFQDMKKVDTYDGLFHYVPENSKI